MEGYIALHRKIMDNEFYNSERFTKSSAWIDLLLRATYKSRTVWIRGIEIKLNPGELCYSQESLAKLWKWNFKTVKKFLKTLGNRNMVETKTNNVTTIITIKNWNEYQFLRNDTVTKSLTHGEQNGDQMVNRSETNNNVNKVNKKTTVGKEKLTAISSKDKLVFNFVVRLYAKLQNRDFESPDFSFLGRVLKLKDVDNITYIRKCLMLCYVIKLYADKTKQKNYKGIIYNAYEELKFNEFKRVCKNSYSSASLNEYEVLN